MAVTNGYCTLAQLRSEVGAYAVSDTGDDSLLETAINAASRQIDGFTGRTFFIDGSVNARTFAADSSRSCWVHEGIATTVGLIAKTDEDGDGTFERTLTITTDFVLKPFNAASRVPAWPYNQIVLVDNYSFPVHHNGRPGVQVTAKFGWPAVPDDITKACLILSLRLFKRKETSSGVVGFDGAGVTVRLSRMDPDVASLLAPYKIIGIA